jgi:hypothetical protein
MGLQQMDTWKPSPMASYESERRVFPQGDGESLEKAAFAS